MLQCLEGASDCCIDFFVADRAIRCPESQAELYRAALGPEGFRAEFALHRDRLEQRAPRLPQHPQNFGSARPASKNKVQVAPGRRCAWQRYEAIRISRDG